MASAEQQRSRPTADPSLMDGDPASLDKVVTGTGSGSDPTGAAGSASAACGTSEGPSKGSSDVAAAADEGERGEDASSPEPSDDESGDSDAEEELIKEEKMRRRLQRSVEVHGPEHEKTIEHTLKLVSSLIAQYKLNDTEALLDDILPACKARGGNVYIRAIQSRAFCLFKQYKFEKALEVFHEQAELVGPSAALFENMAHTYNSLGDYESAGKYFLQAMACMGKEGNNGKKGGILLGLGIVRERQGDPAAALPILQQALENYKQAARTDESSSLIAKAHMSVGQCHEGLGHLDDAAAHIRSAVQIFEKTCGHSSPLTANALGVLGRIFIAQGKSEEAEPLVLESLNLEAAKDAFHPDTVWRLLNTLKEIWTDGGRQMKLEELNAKCKRYEPAIQCCTTRIDELKLEENAKEVGTVSVIFKTAGELFMLAGMYRPAQLYLQRALALLKRISDFDCTVLIQSCVSSLEFLSSIV